MTVRDILSDSYYIMSKELLEVVRNRLQLVLMVIMPVLMLVMFGFIYPNTTAMPEGMSMALIDLSHSGDSAGFIAQLKTLNDQSVKMDFKEVDSVDAARQMINRNELYGAIIIPENFADDAGQGRTANVTVLYDNSNPQVGGQVLAEATGLIQGISGMKSAVMVSELIAGANTTADPQDVLQPYNTKVQGTIPGTNYFDFMAPGLLMMFVMMAAMIGIPEGISKEVELGTFDGVLSSPINPISIIIGKSAALTVGGFFQGIVVMAVAVFFFGVHIQGSILLTFGLLLLGVFSFIGLGILFTSMTEDQKTGTMIVNLLMFPMMFISGIMFPVQQMPWFLQWLSALMPVTYAADAMRKVMILNAGVQDVLPQIAVLIAFGVVTMAIAIPVFKKAMTR